MGRTIDIDTGGTFTDGFFLRNGEVRTVKVATTPHDLTVCLLDCVAAGAAAFGLSVEDVLYDTEVIRFSSTIGTNAIIERDGAKIGVLVTAGTESLVPTRDEHGKEPLVRAQMVAGLPEQISTDGAVIETPGEQEILLAAQTLIDRGARCLLVSFANSEMNPANEQLVRRVIKREYPRDYLGSVPVFLTSDISPRSGDVQRVNTSVLNAYTHGKLTRVLYKAGEDLRQRGYRGTLFIGHNNGTVARVAKTRAVQTYNSGPAAGLIGARVIGRLYGAQDLISIDMGGTSFDVGLVRDGRTSYALEPDIEGFRCNLPMMSIRALGSGGGSIASIVEGVLRVGPRSAGALPGPACFGLGGLEPTVTDADLVLGALDAAYFLGGAMRIDTDRARAAIDTRIAGPLGISVEQAASRIKQSVDDTMGAAVAQARAEFGPAVTPVLIAYGGGAGLHACAIATSAGLGKIILTPFSPVFSAFSSSSIDVGHLYYRRVDVELDEGIDVTQVQDAIADMRRMAARDMRGEGFGGAAIDVELQLFVRSRTGPEVMVHADAGVFDGDLDIPRGLAREALATAGEQTLDHVMLGGLGYMARVAIAHYESPRAAPAKSGVATARKGERPLWLDGATAPVDAPVYDHTRLENGHALSGPAIVESPQTSILVPPGWRLRVDEYNHTLLEEEPR